ncbi:MAG TPA: hypothetical protein VFF73_20545 [Planctomycetota bacterium]|nr:hypothetical protein [Planctomycetota bacterium]
MLTRIAAASLPVLALLAGCYQQDLRLALHEDGAGTIRVRERIAPEASQLLLGSARSDAEKDAKMRELLVEELASWDGVCAWSDSGAWIKDGSIVFEARGWFEDVRKIGRSGPDGLAQRFDWRRDADGTTVEWAVAYPGPDPQTAAACRALSARFKGTVIEATLVMPGSLVSVDGVGASEDPNGAWTLFSGPEIANELRSLEARKASDDAVAAALRARFNHTIVARYETKEPTAIRAAFRKQLERERATFGETDLGREIERARRVRLPNDDGTAAH